MIQPSTSFRPRLRGTLPTLRVRVSEPTRRFLKVSSTLLLNSCNSGGTLRYKKREQDRGRANLRNLRLRSHNPRARDDRRSQ